MGGLVVQGKTLSQMRGDTGVLRLNLTVDGEPYELADGDTAVLTVKKNLKAKSPLLQKACENGLFCFEHADTQGLPTGTYVYDVQVTLADGQVYPVLGPNTYRLLPDVTTNK